VPRVPGLWRVDFLGPPLEMDRRQLIRPPGVPGEQMNSSTIEVTEFGFDSRSLTFYLASFTITTTPLDQSM
jgi:hypothetical protein